MRKKLFFSFTTIVVIVAVTLAGIKIDRVHKARQCGILLAFDDYGAENWENCFDLFDKYNVKVTFFINAEEPTDFCYKAIERGHEIAYHTKNHVRLTEVSQEEVYQQAIAPIEVFREHGIELTTFAYPYGAYNEQLNEQLLQHYNVLRGAYAYQLAGKHEMRHGFVESLSIDNINYESEEMFRKQIDTVLDDLDNSVGGVAGLYSHAISEGAWCVSQERLEYIFQKAQEKGIQFYTYRELQEN